MKTAVFKVCALCLFVSLTMWITNANPIKEIAFKQILNRKIDLMQMYYNSINSSSTIPPDYMSEMGAVKAKKLVPKSQLEKENNDYAETMKKVKKNFDTKKRPTKKRATRKPKVPKHTTPIIDHSLNITSFEDNTTKKNSKDFPFSNEMFDRFGLKDGFHDIIDSLE